MNRSDVLSGVQSVAAAIFGCSPGLIQENTVAGDVQKWDSLRHLMFISAVEKKFDIEFDIDAIANLTNVSDLVTFIQEHARA